MKKTDLRHLGASVVLYHTCPRKYSKINQQPWQRIYGLRDVSCMRWTLIKVYHSSPYSLWGQMLTGRPAFIAETAYGTFQKVNSYKIYAHDANQLTGCRFVITEEQKMTCFSQSRFHQRRETSLKNFYNRYAFKASSIWRFLALHLLSGTQHSHWCRRRLID